MSWCSGQKGLRASPATTAPVRGARENIDRCLERRGLGESRASELEK